MVLPKAPSLDGIRVLDLSRLAPGPYASMILGDMGADVTIVGGGPGSLPISAFARGKALINLDLKSDLGRKALLRLVATADVLIEGYRPGVTSRLGIDYDTLKKTNPRLVYCSLTGYGQDGPLSQEAGHDINYAALSGALGSFGPIDDVPSFPLNLLADFAGGSLFAVIGILSALYARERSGEGQYIDAAMVDGCLSLMAMHFADWGKPVLQSRGDGLVAGSAPYYRCYACADGKFVAIGPLERRFFENLWHGLGFADPAPPQFDRGAWPKMADRFAAAFATRPRDEWVRHFAGKDACVSPVLDPEEAIEHPHNRVRHTSFGREAPVRAPIMHGFEGAPRQIDLADKTVQILTEAGFTAEQIKAARGSNAPISGLAWPPF